MFLVHHGSAQAGREMLMQSGRGAAVGVCGASFPMAVGVAMLGGRLHLVRQWPVRADALQ